MLIFFGRKLLVVKIYSKYNVFLILDWNPFRYDRFELDLVLLEVSKTYIIFIQLKYYDM